jgi:hypothetical protein
MSRLDKVAKWLLMGIVLIAGTNVNAASQPSIVPVGLNVYCVGDQPYASFIMPVKPLDRGRAGIVYVGMRDATGNKAMFLQGNNWVSYESGLLPTFSVLRAGLSDVPFNFPLNSNLAGGGWMLYVGYGVLPSDAEQRIQAYLNMVQKAAASGMKGGNSIDADHYRRTLVQEDMTQNGKYGYVKTGLENNPTFCKI